LARGFTTSRAQSVKSLATGVGFLFLSVMIPTGDDGTGDPTSKVREIIG
jgi:hypothetical protein